MKDLVLAFSVSGHQLAWKEEDAILFSCSSPTDGSSVIVNDLGHHRSRYMMHLGTNVAKGPRGPHECNYASMDYLVAK